MKENLKCIPKCSVFSTINKKMHFRYCTADPSCLLSQANNFKKYRFQSEWHDHPVKSQLSFFLNEIRPFSKLTCGP